MNHGEALDYGLPFARMKNRAGYIVDPTLDAIQQAIDDQASTISSGSLSVDIVDGPGSGSWPLCYITFITVRQNSTLKSCKPLSELLLFLSWTQLNDQASKVGQSLGHAGLAYSWVKRIMDVAGTIYCNNQLAFSTAVLIGMGGPFPVYDNWADEFPTSTFELKYFTSTTGEAINQMILGTLWRVDLCLI